MKTMSFTGSRKGMTKEQKIAFEALVLAFQPEEFRDGDCIGSDADAHHIVEKVSPKTIMIGHPPKYAKYRAFLRYDITHIEKDYLDRNKDIVNAALDEGDILVATPATKEKLRSGSWATIRYARKKNRTIFVINPNGKIKVENRKENHVTSHS